MKVGIPRETFPGERRVALIPAQVTPLEKLGCEVLVEAGAGAAAGFVDEAFQQAGAQVVASRDELFQAADALLMVRAAGANPTRGAEDYQRLRSGQLVVAMCDPLGSPEQIQNMAQSGVTLMALELVPRITRAQSMDVLSSMATIAGYKAVLVAANHLSKIFPLLMTAAGTVTAAKVFVIGAGVAGLQAIATSRRLGAVVKAYDVRNVVKQQIESLGATFVEMAADEEAEGEGGYAKQLGEEFYQRQRALMAEVAAESDVCISTAAIPGKPSPLLISADAVRGMAPGSVIVDLAAERGGNCELSRPDEVVEESGVTILGPTNLPGEVPTHASQMYAKNLATFLAHIVADGRLQLDEQDEIVADTLAARDGQVVNNRLREALGMEPLESPPASPPIDHLAES